MPFRHVVMFEWADDLEPDHAFLVGAALDALRNEIAEIRSLVHGADVGVSEGNFDYVLVADFDTVNEWRTYRDHPQHVLFVAEHIKDKVKRRAAVQFQTPRTDRTAHDVSVAGIQELLAQFDELG